MGGKRKHNQTCRYSPLSECTGLAWRAGPHKALPTGFARVVGRLGFGRAACVFPAGETTNIRYIGISHVV